MFAIRKRRTGLYPRQNAVCLPFLIELLQEPIDALLSLIRPRAPSARALLTLRLGVCCFGFSGPIDLTMDGVRIVVLLMLRRLLSI